MTEDRRHLLEEEGVDAIARRTERPLLKRKGLVRNAYKQAEDLKVQLGAVSLDAPDEVEFRLTFQLL